MFALRSERDIHPILLRGGPHEAAVNSRGLNSFGIEQLDEYRVELVDVGRSWFSSVQLELADESLPENAGNVVASPAHGDHAAA